MKGTSISVFVGLIAASALTLITAPAQAFSFGTGGIQFDKDTQVDFNFEGSNGAYQSTLKIFEVLGSGSLQEVSDVFTEVKRSDNGSANGWLGTAGNTVLDSTSFFTFKKNTTYTFGLVSTYNGNPVTPVYSTSSLNSGGSQQTIFGQYGNTAVDGQSFNPVAYQSGNPFASPLKIAFDDRGNGNDKDFNDFRFTAKAQAVPEPASVAALGMVAGTLTLIRRRKTNQA